MVFLVYCSNADVMVGEGAPPIMLLRLVLVFCLLPLESMCSSI